MPETDVTRSEFMVASSTAAGAAAGSREPVAASSPYPSSDATAAREPLRIVTMDQFEPFEAAQIVSASKVKA